MGNIIESPGNEAPNVVNVVIEIPLGSSIKYEVDKSSGAIVVDRILYTSMFYPFNYGFIPGTLEEDGDPVDVLVVGYEPLIPGSIIKVKPIGLLEMEDEEGPDAKVVAVPLEKIDPRFKHVNRIDDLPDIIKDKIRHFFEHYKELEPGKWVKVRDWKGPEEAKNRIKKAIENYSKHR
ncbi:MAG TPA: inorganic diphosphatase [Thermofilum sp.]|nr:inorganic diphosphatase [Thermofilum sp.]